MRRDGFAWRESKLVGTLYRVIPWFPPDCSVHPPLWGAVWTDLGASAGIWVGTLVPKARALASAVRPNPREPSRESVTVGIWQNARPMLTSQPLRPPPILEVVLQTPQRATLISHAAKPYPPKLCRNARPPFRSG
jgi:hypothetical protein